MKKKKDCSFRNAIRKTLLFYALTPCIILLLAATGAFSIFVYHQVIESSQSLADQLGTSFDEIMDQYQRENQCLAGQICLPGMERDLDERARIAGEAAQFCGEQQIHGLYYLFDEQKRIVYTTDRAERYLHWVKGYLSWLAELSESQPWIMVQLEDAQNGGESLTAWLNLCHVGDEKNQQGYSVFLLTADQIDPKNVQIGEKALIINPYGRVFSVNHTRFQDKQGQICAELRDSHSLLKWEEQWYYSVVKPVLGGEAWLQILYDCTFLVRLVMVAVLLIIALALILSAAIYYSAGRVADEKTAIVYQLIGALDEVERGNLDTKLEIHTGDEFEKISNAFHTMLESMRELICRQKEMARENMLANAEMLKAQFNPHFLFNTLESIRYLIGFDPENAEKMLVSLSRMLRYSIQSDSEMVPLSMEMENVSRYLEIMRYRYGEWMQYHIHVDPSAAHDMVPRMILQPLVENAIQYGPGDTYERLDLQVCASVRLGTLKITISDNGVGIEPELNRKLQENLKNPHNELEHIGLYNVHNSIRLRYGEPYGLKLESLPGQGTTVTVTVPRQTEKGEINAAESGYRGG